MDFAAKHLGFVIGSYGLSFAVLAGLVLWVIARDRRMRAEADAAEKRKRP
jgi:heme exporter protein CcmD